jgi:hypothetical protein
MKRYNIMYCARRVSGIIFCFLFVFFGGGGNLNLNLIGRVLAMGQNMLQFRPGSDIPLMRWFVFIELIFVCLTYVFVSE